MAAPSQEHALDAPEPAPPSRLRQVASLIRRAWPVLRFIFGIGIVVVAYLVLSSNRGELAGFSQVFRNLRWWWVPPALFLELASFVCFAGLQYEFLASGGLAAPEGSLLKMSFASQAITNSLPGGNAFSAVYGFRWFRRFGADDKLAAWSLVGTLVASIVSLSLVATAGLALATGEGASLDLIPVIVGVFVITLAIGALFIYERPLAFVVTWGIRVSRKLVGRPRGDVADNIARIVALVTSEHLTGRRIIRIVLWGCANWIFDCGCFALMFLAVNSSIPWKGLLLAYGAGQLAANLPFTPGGLGVVEGSITIALVEFGGSLNSTYEAVLMYRVISFWLVLVVGWLLWCQLAYQVRRGRWTRQALQAPVEAALHGDEGSGPSRADPMESAPGVM